MSFPEAQIAVAKTVRNEPLEKRVRVRERIAIDKGIDVAEEIERLRDERVG